MGFNSAFKGLKLLKKPRDGRLNNLNVLKVSRLNNLNDPVLNVLIGMRDSPCIRAYAPSRNLK